MSWWVYLNDPVKGKPVEVPLFHEGGTRATGGCSTAELNVTYNYSEALNRCGLDMRKLDGTTAADTIPLLENVVQQLGTKRDDNYWNPTDGNAGHAASILLGWAKQRPDGVWEVH